MKKSSTLFLKIIICLSAVVVFAGLIWFPKTEGRATNLDLFSIYTDPFIVYIYLASMAFFFGLHQGFKLLKIIDENKAFSQAAVSTLKNIKITSLALIGFIAIAEFYIHFFAQGDDIAGPTMMGLLMIIAFGVIATASGIFQKLFQNAVDIKSENDLTV